MKTHRLITIAMLLWSWGAVAAAQDAPLPSASQVIEQMLARDAQRRVTAKGYAGMRRYVLLNKRWNKHAEMVVRVQASPDGIKQFEVVSESGSKTVRDKVFRKMLESESETSLPEMRENTRLGPDNYEFQMGGIEKDRDRTLYVVDVTPKRKDKYLFRGRIWVDSQDFALVRSQGSPAKNPSFWTRHVDFKHSYQKSGDYWFPVSTESETQVLIIGTTTLVIEYFDYKANTESVTASRGPSARKGAAQ